MKIIQALGNSNILIKGVTKTIKKKKGGFLIMLLGTLGASLLGNLLTGKGIFRAGSSCPLSSTSKNKKGIGILRAGSGNKKGKVILRAGSGKEWDF